MFKRIANFLLIGMLVWSSAFASINDKQKECQRLLISEFKNILAKDNGLIQAQLTLTAMKLAKKVLKRGGLNSKTIEAYTQSIIGNKTIERLGANENIQNEILDTFNSYSGKTKYLDSKVQIERLKDLENLSDEDISKLMIQLQTTWKDVDDFGFNQNDFAFSWFVNTANKNSSGEDSFIISNAVKDLLNNTDSDKDIESVIAENIKNASLKMKAEIEKTKVRVFEKNKDTCLNYFGDDQKNQNTSIYENATCSLDEKSILEESVLSAITDILKTDEIAKEIKLEIKENRDKPKDSSQRQLQDKINQMTYDKDKIIEFYKSGLGPKNCSGFLIVDKKNNKTSLHLNNGDEVFTSKAIMGTGQMDEYKEFHPDSILRKWKVKDSNGDDLKKNGKYVYKYTRTTGAGTFYMDKSLSSEERSKRAYDKEFNDRVMVMYSKRDNGNREEVQAIHGVPNIGWVKNRDSRMQSFDDESISRKLSTGCVNLEGYTYDIMDEFIENNCPMYILPEDKDNFYFIKNGELKFTTDIQERKNNKEHSKMKLSNGEKIDDPKNYNQFNFTPLNRKNLVKSYKLSSGSSEVLDSILSSKETLYKRALKMENDDFEDLASLTFAITNNKEKAVEVFINLYNSQYRAELSDRLTQEEKRKAILKSYEKEFDTDIKINSTLDKAREVIFSYE